MALEKRGRAGALSGTVLLGIALLTMAVDHAAWAFVPTLSAAGVALHFVGRTAGPLLFYLLVEFYYSSRNIFKTQWRLLLYAALCWPVFVFYLYGLAPGVQGWLHLGLPFTLLLGLVCLRVRHEVKQPVLRVALLIALAALSLLGDWPVFGILYVLIFDAFRENMPRRNLAITALIVLSAIPASLAEWPFAIYQMGQFVPLLLLRFAGGTAPKRGVFTAALLFYPLHLALLCLLRLLL